MMTFISLLQLSPCLHNSILRPDWILFLTHTQAAPPPPDNDKHVFRYTLSSDLHILLTSLQLEYLTHNAAQAVKGRCGAHSCKKMRRHWLQLPGFAA